MRRATWTAAALALLAGAVEPGSILPSEADVTARLVADPAEAEIGQPVTWELTVEHPAGISIAVPAESPLPDDSWVLLEEARRVTRPAAEPGRRRTVVRWEVMSLDSGERALPPLPIDYDADGVPRRLAAEAGTLVVRGALAEGEDDPRPPVGFRPAPAEVARPSLAPLGVLAALVLGGLAWLVARRLRRRAARPAPAPAPAERLAALEARRGEAAEAADPEAVRALYYELSAIVREAVDRRATDEPAPQALTDEAVAPQALTDEEWLARMRRRAALLPPEVPDTVEELLRRAESVKYGRGAPTRFAVDEAFADARRVVDRVAGADDGPASRTSGEAPAPAGGAR